MTALAPQNNLLLSLMEFLKTQVVLAHAYKRVIVRFAATLEDQQKLLDEVKSLSNEKSLQDEVANLFAPLIDRIQQGLDDEELRRLLVSQKLDGPVN